MTTLFIAIAWFAGLFVGSKVLPEWATLPIVLFVVALQVISLAAHDHRDAE